VVDQLLTASRARPSRRIRRRTTRRRAPETRCAAPTRQRVGSGRYRPPRASPRPKQALLPSGNLPPATPAHIYDLLQWVYYGYGSVSSGGDEPVRLDRFTMRRLMWVGIGFFFAGFFARGVQIAYPGTPIAQFIDIIRFLLVLVGVSTLLLYAFILIRKLGRGKQLRGDCQSGHDTRW